MIIVIKKVVGGVYIYLKSLTKIWKLNILLMCVLWNLK